MPKFVPRQRKHKVRRREGDGSGGGSGTVAGAEQHNPSSAELILPSKSEKEEKRRLLRVNLGNQQPEIAGKKRKRLEKYIVRIQS